MAHDVESMVYVGETPWQGLEVAVPKEIRLKVHEAIAAAGLDWQVEKCRLFADGGGIQGGLRNHYATIRDRDNRCQTLDNRMDSRWFGESDRINALARQTTKKMAV